jgi:hypothetical protein
MLSKLLAIWDLFKLGSRVDDPALWKNRQITVTLLVPVILAAFHALSMFGVPIQIDPETANGIAAGIIAVVNVVLTITTTDKVGLPTKTDDDNTSTNKSVSETYHG